MTRAPASASRQVHCGAATACSMEMTRRPWRGRATLAAALSAVMPGVVPGIHVLFKRLKAKRWMAGTSHDDVAIGARPHPHETSPRKRGEVKVPRRSDFININTTAAGRAHARRDKKV